MSWGKGRVLPCPFSKIGKKFTDSQKKCPDLGKNVLFECIYGLNSHLKCSFKGILEKNTKMFHCGALLFYLHMECLFYMEYVPIPRNLPCLKKFLLALLIFVPYK